MLNNRKRPVNGIKKISVLFKKEFKETIRDKSVLISNFLIPMLSTPIMFILVGLITGLKVMQKKKHNYTIYVTEKVPTELVLKLKNDSQLSFIKKELSHTSLTEKNKNKLLIEIKKNKVDLVINKNKKDLQLIADFSSKKTTFLMKKLRPVFLEFKKQKVQEVLRSKNLTQEDINPIKLKEVSLTPLSKFAANNFGGQAGAYILILLVIGMYYPSINAFIGEKEKKTLKTLVYASGNDWEIIISKYLNIVLFGLLTLVPYFFQIVCIPIILKFFSAKGFAFLSKLMTFNLSFLEYGIFILNTLVLALVIGAFCILITAIANTTQRAQAYLTGFMLIFTIPMVVLSVMDLNLDLKTSLVPVLNFLFYFKKTAASESSGLLSLNIFFSNMALMFVLLGLGQRVFNQKYSTN